MVGDTGWGHLQIDATSIYLLMLAQMIALRAFGSGQRDEVNFVQNLVYYIEALPHARLRHLGARRQAQRSVEINASSVGMAKAALEAWPASTCSVRGRQDSVMHVVPDNIARHATR